MQSQVQDTLRQWEVGNRLLQQSHCLQARAAFTALVDSELAIPARLRLSLIASRMGDLREATTQALQAFQIETAEPQWLELLAKRLLSVGEREAFLLCVRRLAASAPASVQSLAEVGKLALDAGFVEDARVLLRRAHARGLDTPALRYLLALADMQCGELVAAESGLVALLRRQPDFAKAHWLLSKLHPDRPHAEQLQQLIPAMEQVARGGRTGADNDLALLYYALFRTLDASAEHGPAAAALAKGMAARRQRVRYDGAAEASLFARIRQACDGAFVNAAIEAPEGPTPIFIIGLPRSGTTLLERMLGSHSQVADAGELPDFLLQLRWLANRAGPVQLDAALLEDALGIDAHTLGQRYLDHAAWLGSGKPFFTDKLPFNFQLAGLIMRALPQARFLHMVREPMDVCFSNLKELFAGAYAYSYDQIEMADHYRRYRQLMAHWQQVAPGRILDVSYSELVRDPEAVCRRVLDYCALPFEPACLSIEARRSPVSTASSVQVREGIHTRAMGNWLPYASFLQPLRERLGAYAVLDVSAQPPS